MRNKIDECVFVVPCVYNDGWSWWAIRFEWFRSNLEIFYRGVFTASMFRANFHYLPLIFSRTVDTGFRASRREFRYTKKKKNWKKQKPTHVYTEISRGGMIVRRFGSGTVIAVTRGARAVLTTTVAGFGHRIGLRVISDTRAYSLTIIIEKYILLNIFFFFDRRTVGEFVVLNDSQLVNN